MPREKIITNEDIDEQASRSEVVDPHACEAEETHLWNLRPKNLSEYIGQMSVVENLQIAIKAACMRKDPLEHVLLHGAPGLGKTTLAHIIAAEMGASIISTSGPALEKPRDVMGILSSLEVGDVLFIDEIHRLSRVIEEFLYSAMEDFQVDFVLDKGAYAKTIKVPLKRFTLVGATTRAGMLSAPMRDRFGLFAHMDYYSTEELTLVVQRSARNSRRQDGYQRRDRGLPVALAAPRESPTASSAESETTRKSKPTESSPVISPTSPSAARWSMRWASTSSTAPSSARSSSSTTAAPSE